MRASSHALLPVIGHPAGQGARLVPNKGQHQMLQHRNRAIATTPTGPLIPDRAEQTRFSKRAGQHNKRASRVAIFVEPSPFSHVSGMKNRFESLIRGLTQAGDEVMVFTPDQDPPEEFCGAKVCA